MRRVEHEDPLDDAAQEWLRTRISIERGEVTDFTLQYETTIDGERVAVVRYDCAHGFPHRDILDRRGVVVSKQPLPGNPDLKTALALARHDLRENWPRYRAKVHEGRP